MKLTKLLRSRPPMALPVCFSLIGSLYMIRALLQADIAPDRISCLFYLLIWGCLTAVLVSGTMRRKVLIDWIGPREQICCFLSWGAVVLILVSWLTPGMLVAGSLRYAPVFVLLLLTAGFYALMSDGRAVRLCMIALILLLCGNLLLVPDFRYLGWDPEVNRLRVVSEGFFLVVIYTISVPLEQGCSSEILKLALEPFLSRDCPVMERMRQGFHRVHSLLCLLALLWILCAHCREIARFDFSFWPQLMIAGLILLLCLNTSPPAEARCCSFLIAVPVLFKLAYDMDEASFLASADCSAVCIAAEALLLFCVLLKYQTAFNLVAASECFLLTAELVTRFLPADGRRELLLGPEPLLYGAEILLLLGLLGFGYGAAWAGRSEFAQWLESFLGLEFEDDDTQLYIEDPENGGAS
ncbi:MAG: hypothetical protein IJH75_05930 [Mogibacterium sp.]|nr:hypothetical protein [Mogibacterium sp.]